MKSQFVIPTDTLSSYNWITNKHLKKCGSIFFFFFFLLLEKDQRRRNQFEKLPANLSATGKKKKKLTDKAKKQMDNWR